MKKILFIFCFGVSVTFAQKAKFSRSEYPLGKISFSDFVKANARSLTIKNDSVFYYNTDFSAWEATPLSNINYLRVQEGSQAGKGALLGGLTTALTLLSGVINVSSDPNQKLKENALSTSLLIIAGGTGLGALIGVATPRWKTYYLGNQKIGKISILPKIRLNAKEINFTIKYSI